MLIDLALVKIEEDESKMKKSICFRSTDEEDESVELYPPPSGEGETCNALSKDLRRSLEWSLEDGWTLPSTEKEEAERKVDAFSSTVESLREELLNERNISRAAKESVERAIEERTVVSRVVQSVGCIMKILRCHWLKLQNLCPNLVSSSQPLAYTIFLSECYRKSRQTKHLQI
ncbi:Uncharacterized protein Rs2_35788 [Raphanus sativus]|nr:Uncharacterized protein Rs2_35788 [Raphanus sativus]